jgi:hypothetical protein
LTEITGDCSINAGILSGSFDGIILWCVFYVGKTYIENDFWQDYCFRFL